jgi:hypothetical protein
MEKAGPQPAAAIEHALGMLELVWGDDYAFGHDSDKGLWAVRRGKIGPLATAATPEELGEKLADGPGACRRVHAVIAEGDREQGRAVHAGSDQEPGPGGHLAAPAGALVMRPGAVLRAGAGS